MGLERERRPGFGGRPSFRGDPASGSAQDLLDNGLIDPGRPGGTIGPPPGGWGPPGWEDPLYKAWYTLNCNPMVVVHFALDLLGTVRNEADLANTAIYLYERDYLNAGISLVSAVGGDIVKVFKGPLKRVADAAPGYAKRAMEKIEDAFRIGSCFPAGTPVQTESGPMPIEEVQVGEKVWACDPTTGEWQLEDVLQTSCRDYQGDIVTVTLSVTLTSPDGQVQATGNHPFWVTSGDGLESRPGPTDLSDSDRTAPVRGRWIEARHLQAGDVLMDTAGQPVCVAAVSTSIQRAKVYNFLVDRLHTYAVGATGVLVHNQSLPRPPLDNLSKAAAAPDRNRLTKAGKALQKHSDRAGSAFANPTGSKKPGDLNQAGQDIVDDILTAPGSTTTPNNRGGWDIIAPDGRGLSFGPDGSFKGFLEPKTWKWWQSWN